MSTTLTDHQTLLAFKAGRSFRRQGTNLIDANPTKGAVVLSNSEDGLLHFIWKDRATGNLGEDLILFPGDATFDKVAQAPGGRTYVLRFESSDQRHFFWMQDASTRRDDEFVHNLNRLLADPTIIPVWDSRTAESSRPSTSTPGASTSQTPAAPAGPSDNNAAPLPAGMTPEHLARLRALVTSMGANTGSTPADDDVSLTDILTPATLLPLTSNPELLTSIFPHLPPESLPSGNGPLTPEQTVQLTDTLQRAINSTPFRTAVVQLDRALRTGALGSFVRSLGLPESAGTGVRAFLTAIGEQVAREAQRGGESGQEDMMEED